MNFSREDGDLRIEDEWLGILPSKAAGLKPIVVYTEKIRLGRNIMKLTIIFVISSFVFGGCSLFEGGEKAEVKFRLNRSEFLNQNNIRIDIFDGRKVYRVDEFVDFESKAFATRTRGTLELSIRVISPQNDVLSSGELELELKEDWRWEVNLRPGEADYDPLFGCFGCIAHYAFEVNKDAVQDSGQFPDSLYVVVGGNYISEPVDY